MLTLGNEKIDYGYGNTKTKLFLGPTFEEKVGLSIADKLLIEAGAYQIKFFGSDMLPEDIGYTLGMYIVF